MTNPIVPKELKLVYPDGTSSFWFNKVFANDIASVNISKYKEIF